EIGDIDGDGLADVLMGPAETFRKGGDHILAWYKNPGNSNNTNWSKKVLESGTNRMHQVKLADMDNDGDLDAVTGQAWDPKTIRIFHNDGKGNFSAPVQVIQGKGLYSSAIIDMDNDGDLDIVGCENYTGNTFMYRNLHSGTEPEPNLPPAVSISANLTKGFAPLTVTFSATASDSDGIGSYKWTFGDGSGNSANTKNTTYTYTAIGTHTAKLVVTDNKGATTTKTINITVEEDVVVPDPESTIVDDNNSAVTYNGWGLDQANKYTKGAHNDTLHWSKTVGAKASLDFEGTWIKLFCKTATNGNVIRVSVDGGSPTDINLNGNGEQQQLVFNKQGLSAGSHTIVVECRGSAVHIDYFEFGGDSTEPNPGPSEPIAYSASEFFTSNNINAKGHVKTNSWLGYEVDFENGRDTVKLEVSSGRNGGTIQCRLDSRDGEILGSVYVPNTGGWDKYIDVHCFIGNVTGPQDLYFTFDGGLKTLLDIESFELASSTVTSNSLEAESALLSNAVADSSVDGSSEGSYAVIAKDGFAGWTVNAPSAGKYTLVFAYSLMAETNEMELLVNDTLLPSYMLFTQSEGWSKFSVEVELKSGENDIVLSNVGNSIIEIDSMDIRSVK
ncbi:MAG: carbohydrate-binding protein, partial [Lentisphaeraceae bacterium]|nr:carbohydrate-binding protein [Lentisphaeraceae bacterium]